MKVIWKKNLFCVGKESNWVQAVLNGCKIKTLTLSDTVCHVILHVLKIAFTRTNNQTNCIDLYYVCAQVGRKNRFFCVYF